MRVASAVRASTVVLAALCAVPATARLTAGPADAAPVQRWGTTSRADASGGSALPPAAGWGSLRGGSPALSVTSLGLASGSAVAGQPVTVRAVVRARTTSRVDGLIVAVRDGSGANLDFPYQPAVTVAAGGTELSVSRTFPAAGTYTYWVAYEQDGRWTDLDPRQSLTVGPAVTSGPITPSPTPTGGTATAATPAAPRWSGVYTGWPQTAAKLDAFGTWRGRAVDVALDYLDDSTWSSIEGPSWWTAGYAGTRYAEHPVISVPMLPQDPSTSLAAGATGAYDGHFRTLAQHLVAAGMGAATIRPGWEFTSPTNYRWSAVGDPADFAAYFRHIVTAMRAVSPSFTFDLCSTVAVDGNAIDTLAAAWPGDGYVDMLGLDLYDASWGPAGSAAARWSWLSSGRSGLDALGAFATAHSVPVALDEWAVTSPSWLNDGGGGDDPAFVSSVHDWLAARPVHHETYTDVNFGYTDGRLSTGDYPQAAARYRTLFGG